MRWLSSLLLGAMVLTPTYAVSADFPIKIGGRVMGDWAFFTQDDGFKARVDDFQDGTEIRRARIALSGKVAGNVAFKTQYDFSAGKIGFKDVYFELGGLPLVGHVRVGQFKEPFTLEVAGSSNHIRFMERSLAFAFAPDRNSGLMLHDGVLDERATWAAGVFREVDSNGNGAADGKYNVTGRVTGLPLYANDGQMLLHLGLGISHREPVDSTVQYSERPESHLAGKLIDTGRLTAGATNLVGIEAMLVAGSVSLQGEYNMARVDVPVGSDPTYYGYYAEVSFCITGEHRQYKRSSGAPLGVTPRRNFDGEGGYGAWELGARYSFCDLDEPGTAGGEPGTPGELKDLTLGLNWYLNANSRWMINYVRAEHSVEGYMSIVQTRFQVNF